MKAPRTTSCRVQLAPPSVCDGVNQLDFVDTLYSRASARPAMRTHFLLPVACPAHCCHWFYNCGRVETIFLRPAITGCPLMQVRQTGNGGYDVTIASCTAQSSAAVMTSRKSGVPLGSPLVLLTSWGAACTSQLCTWTSSPINTNFNNHLNYLPSCICCWDLVNDVCMSTNIDTAGYLSSTLLVSVPL